jgi:hypothetical protein
LADLDAFAKANARRLVAQLVEKSSASRYAYASLFRPGEILLSSNTSGETRAEALRVAIGLLTGAEGPALSSNTRYVLPNLVLEILRRETALTEEDLRLCIAFELTYYVSHATLGPIPQLVAYAERLAAGSPLSEASLDALARLRARALDMRPAAAARKLLRRLDLLLGQGDRIKLDPRDVWGAAAIEDINQMSEWERAPWIDLLALGQATEGARPSKKWLSQAASALDRIGRGAFCHRATSWMERVGVSAPEPGAIGRGYSSGALPKDENACSLRAVVWAATLVPDAGLARAVADLGLVCFTKVPDQGAYSEKLGNACVHTLGHMPCPEAIGELARLRLRVKYVGARRLIAAAYDAAAKRAGVTTEEIEEATVPTCGLGPQASLRQQVGRYSAEIRLIGSKRAELHFSDPAGRPLKGIPKELRTGGPGELRGLRRAVRDIDEHLAAQKRRLEQMMSSGRFVAAAQWKARYLEHPIVGPIARELIWELKDDTTAIPHEGLLVDMEDRPLDLGHVTAARVWHPLRSSAGVVASWQRWLLNHRTTQPFKQAHRETFEAADNRSSDGIAVQRFAGHFLREWVLAALCRQRGWRYELQIGNPGSCPRLEFPDRGEHAELAVTGIGEWSDAFDTLVTSEVRFLKRDGSAVLLESVPPILLSEVLRDVDLLVSASSIGRDSQGASRYAGPARVYWEEFALGQLGQTARHRQRTIESLLQYLDFGDRCRIDGPFLTVQGKHQAYAIHLGSAHVITLPERQTLFLPPARTRKAQVVWLPFEGDAVLAEILTNARLLAHDQLPTVF